MMTQSFKDMPEPQRRRHQEELGLVAQRRTSPPVTEKKRTQAMEQPQQNQGQSQQRGAGASRAQQSIEHMLARMENPPTLKEVAIHELKRAAVWAPMLVTTAVGLMWVQKKFFFGAFVAPVKLP